MLKIEVSRIVNAADAGISLTLRRAPLPSYSIPTATIWDTRSETRNKTARPGITGLGVVPLMAVSFLYKRDTSYLLGRA